MVTSEESNNNRARDIWKGTRQNDGVPLKVDRNQWVDPLLLDPFITFHKFFHQT